MTDEVLKYKAVGKDKNDIELIADALKDMMRYELQCEALRIQLANQKDFKIPTLYKQFDDNFSNEITPEELIYGLKTFDIIADL